MGMFTFSPLILQLWEPFLRAVIYWITTETQKAFIFQNLPSLHGSPNSPKSFFQLIPWTSQVFCLKRKGFQGINKTWPSNFASSPGRWGEGETLVAPLFPYPNLFSKILTSTGWRSRLIRQESLAWPPAADFRGLRAPPPFERGVMKTGEKRRGAAAAHNGAIICLKFHPLRSSLHNSSVIKPTVVALKTWLWEGRGVFIYFGASLREQLPDGLKNDYRRICTICMESSKSLSSCKSKLFKLSSPLLPSSPATWCHSLAFNNSWL